MKVVVGSKNEAKRLAVMKAFQAVYTDDDIEVQTLAVDSDVSSHPTTDEESLRGAFNRARNARRATPEADFYVGIEGGLLRVSDRAWEHSWVVVEDKNGVSYTALSAGLELRGKLLEAVLGGQELSHAFAEQHGIEGAGNKNGMYGFATDDVVTRESATVDAMVFALAPFKKPEYFK